MSVGKPSSGAIARSEERAFFRTPYGRHLLPLGEGLDPFYPIVDSAAWVARLVGGILGGVIYRWLSDEPHGQVVGTSA